MKFVNCMGDCERCTEIYNLEWDCCLLNCGAEDRCDTCRNGIHLTKSCETCANFNCTKIQGGFGVCKNYIEKDRD